MLSATKSRNSNRCAKAKASFFADELPEDIREKVLEKHRDWNTDTPDWWDCTIEDAKRMGALLGIEADDVTFSGFWSQGDGASFTGTYTCKPDAIKAVKAECNDEKLIEFATELTQLQVTLKLKYGSTYQCTIVKTDSRCSHSGSISTSWNDSDPAWNEQAPEDLWDFDRQFEALMRRFADWIYASLESEHTYLSSDECILQSLRDNDLKFTADGVRIERRSK